jgi:hypothetical protein
MIHPIFCGEVLVPWALSPTDLTFLWDDCPRCFYNKIVLKQPRPRGPFPVVFNQIDRAMKDCYLGERADALVPGMPPGVFVGRDQWVRSAAIVPMGANSACLIRGRVDVLVDCDDGTTAVIDMKTAEPGAANVEKYSRQLHAYALALENPASGPATTVSELGLLSFVPASFVGTDEKAALCGDLRWLEVERDDEAFLCFLTEVVSVLEQPEPPPASPECCWCAWHGDIRVLA